MLLFFLFSKLENCKFYFFKITTLKIIWDRWLMTHVLMWLCLAMCQYLTSKNNGKSNLGKCQASCMSTRKINPFQPFGISSLTTIMNLNSFFVWSKLGQVVNKLPPALTILRIAAPTKVVGIVALKEKFKIPTKMCC